MFNLSRLLALIVMALVIQAHAQEMNRGEAIRAIAVLAKEQLAGRHADLETPDGALEKSVVGLIGMPDGPYGDGRVNPDGRYIISGCRPQSCNEKGIAIFSMKPARLDAFGLQNFHCRFALPGIPDSPPFAPQKKDAGSFIRCNKEPILTVYIVRTGFKSEDFSRELRDLETIRNWAIQGGVAAEEIRVIDAER